VIACNDWLRLGPGRSIAALLSHYLDKSNFVKRFNPPSQSSKTLATWSSRFKWSERARVFDAEWEQLKNQERQAELNFGLALDDERIRKLKRLAEFLEAQVYELSAPDDDTGQQVYHNVWLPDVKQIGSGDDAEKVDIERFNSGLIIQYRETLEDLAAEVGGRVKRQEVAGAGKDGAIRIELKWANDADDHTP
jgi:hypothetical protein